MCPKCNGPTVTRPLFTSLYQHCERCENPPKQAAPSASSVPAIDSAPFAVGDTVYSLKGFTAKPRVVDKIDKRKVRQIKRRVWLARS